MKRPTFASLRVEWKSFLINWEKELDPYSWMPNEIREIEDDSDTTRVYYSDKVFEKTGVFYKVIDRSFKSITYEGESTYTRPDGPAKIDVGKRTYEWLLFDKFHRVGGPAWLDAGGMIWSVNNKNHRVDGPAYVDFYNQIIEYWVNGRELKEKEFFRHFG